MNRTVTLVAAGLAANAFGSPGLSAAATIDVVSSPPDLVTAPRVLVRVRGTNLRPVGWSSNDTLLQPFYQDKNGDWFGLIGQTDPLIPGTINIFVAPDITQQNQALMFNVTVHAADQPLFPGARPASPPCPPPAKAADASCNPAPRITYIYRTTQGAWAVLPSGPHPADIAKTMTSAGFAAPMIVRVDEGLIDGVPYALAFLDDPTADGPEPWPAGPAPAAWNGTLMFATGDPVKIDASNAGRVGPFDLGSSGNASSGACAAALIGGGYAVAAAQITAGPAASDAATAEAVLRSREIFIRSYGLPSKTVGVAPTGDSATALARIAKAYPGLDAVVTPSSVGCPG